MQLGLARHWLSEHEFGAFAAAYVSFLVLGVFQTALLTEPVAVFGAERYHDRLPNYLGKTVGIHLLISFIGGVLLACIGAWQLFWGEHTLGVALCALAVAQVFQLLPWTLRVACYLDSDPKHAGIAGLIYLVLVVGLLLGFDALGWMGVPAAVASMALSSLAICIYLMTQLRVSLRAVFERAGYRAVLQDHWRYGKWAVPTGMLRWVPEHMPILATPLVLGWAAGSEPDFESGGALKAMLHLSVPFVLFTWALSTLLVPMLVRRRGTPAFGKLSWQMLGVTFAVTLFAWPIIGMNHDRIIGIVYAGRFLEHAWLLWLVGLIPVVVAIDSVLHAQFRAVERPDRLFYGSAASSAVLVLAGLPMLAFWGLPGILSAVLLCYTVQAAVLWLVGGSIIRAACASGKGVASAGNDATLEPTPRQETTRRVNRRANRVEQAG
ncbi:MAG: lipopolysaccharide biosynthesis protein [Phycisphaerales bacterium JB063]